MDKITFLGAGSTVFAKNVLGDCMQTDALREFEYALYDIDEIRLDESYQMLSILNKNINSGKAKIKKYTDRIEALRGAKYVINAIQVGGYDPCTITDFKIPEKYGLRQTIGDTVGIGGIFRALRTIPVMLEFVRDMEKVCPDALFLNYTNPMAMLTMAMLKSSPVRTIGICHSVQVCVPQLLYRLGLPQDGVRYKIAGINHMAWLLEVTRNGEDYYPEIKKRAETGPIIKPYTKDMLKDYPQLLYPEYEFTPEKHDDLVRFEIMKQFGYYVTESSEHNAEFMPYFIKKNHPELIEKYQIPLNEYLRRCKIQIEHWNSLRDKLVCDVNLTHGRTHEYPSYILEALETGKPFTFAGNVMNHGLIDNLPQDCCVEVTCVADQGKIQPCVVGSLPHQLAALNMGNIGMQQLTVDAALTGKKEYIYQAAMLDPHTSSELTIDEIRSMVDEMIEAHGTWLPKYH
ncbi:alpha-glucosidase/alpha-galactosidase [Mediterraneibacter agrestimuris]|uniref:alpha-glucosidase/alpha-galactosidase n=1 Tax=Mediterraneibacter agrestimuris TaxID=2941333 RepID=UPI00203BCCD9|nr:alpha-glucosidase/alpha-galactosidase [Mediterraneibacter agrestimuris]